MGKRKRTEVGGEYRMRRDVRHLKRKGNGKGIFHFRKGRRRKGKNGGRENGEGDETNNKGDGRGIKRNREKEKRMVG